jgi:ectoine hydroxylase-related dioxygenase (phytanoyl-CoA dioxygenase family)
MDQQLFLNINKENEFREKGFTILDLPNQDVLEQIETIYESKIYPKLKNDTDFYYSLSNDLSFNLQIKDLLSNALNNAYKEWFRHFDHFAESFLIKRAHDASELTLHQDWNFVDENRHISVTLWCPLYETSQTNGGFFLIEKSHNFFKNLRSDSYQTSRIPSSQKLNEIIKPIHLKRGQVLAFHPAIFHGSFPNNSNKERPIASTLIKSKQAPLLHYSKKDNTTANVFEIEEKTLLSELVNLSNSIEPSLYHSKKQINYMHQEIDEDMLIKNYFDRLQ